MPPIKVKTPKGVVYMLEELHIKRDHDNCFSVEATYQSVFAGKLFKASGNHFHMHEDNDIDLQLEEIMEHL